MAQWINTLPAESSDLNLGPRMHRVGSITNSCKLPFDLHS